MSPALLAQGRVDYCGRAAGKQHVCEQSVEDRVPVHRHGNPVPQINETALTPKKSMSAVPANSAR
jgi:hypothetical protein